MREKITLSKAARRLMGDIASAPVSTAADLLTTFLKIPYEIGSNKSLFGGGKIVPSGKEGTDEETKLKARYAAEGLFRPAREARSIIEQINQDQYDFASSRWGLGLPLRKTQGEGYIEQFYELYDEAQQPKKTAALYKRQRRPEDVREYRAENRPEIQAAGYLKQTADKIAQLRRGQDIVREDKTLTDKAKHLRIDAISGRMIAYAKQAVERQNSRAMAGR